MQGAASLEGKDARFLRGLVSTKSTGSRMTGGEFHMNKINVAVVSGRELKPDDLLLRMIREDGSLYYVGTVSNEDEVKNLMELDPPDMLLFSSIVPKLVSRLAGVKR